MSRHFQDEWIDPVDFRIGNTIRMLRIVRGMSQQALARELDVTFQQVQKYEKAKTHIAASRLYEVARVLDTPIEAFFDSPETDQSAQAAIRDMVDRYDLLSPQFGYHEFVELNRAMVGITDPAVRRSVLKLIGEIGAGQKDETQTAETGRNLFRPAAPADLATEDGRHHPRSGEAEPVQRHQSAEPELA